MVANFIKRVSIKQRGKGLFQPFVEFQIKHQETQGLGGTHVGRRIGEAGDIMLIGPPRARTRLTVVGGIKDVFMK